MIATDSKPRDLKSAVPGLDTWALRRGLILRAVAKGPKAKQYEPVSRSVADARKLGLLIYENFDQYSEAIRCALVAEAKAADLQLENYHCEPQGLMKSRFAPGLILDFPAFSCSVGRFSVTGRSCVTVCFAETASKIWSRLVIRATGASPATLSKASVAKQILIASRGCATANKAVRALYLRDFKSTLPPNDYISVRFEKVGELNYIGIDEDPDTIAQAVGAIEEQSQPDDEAVSRLQTRLHSLACAVSGETSNVQEKRSGGRQIRTFNSRKGTPAVFQSWVDDTKATFAIASARADPLPAADQEKLGRVRNSSALDVMSELANLMAAEF